MNAAKRKKARQKPNMMTKGNHEKTNADEPPKLEAIYPWTPNSNPIKGTAAIK
ncbi:MAG: hypothetical protein J6038_05475 [Bacilli bacterium]|nr:hypothetical protein [Bacilli bacterium]